jgi:hypothetical protein
MKVQRKGNWIILANYLLLMGQDNKSNFGFLCRRLILDCPHKHEVPRSG